MIEDAIIGFLTVFIAVVGYFLWECMIEKFKINGSVAAVIAFVAIILFVGAISCILDPSCKSLY